jgi:alkylation response protein AidB-like acyl-CoA dehydrogenase
MDEQTVIASLRDVAVAFAGQRRERQHRRKLDPADFDRIRQAGFHRLSQPIEEGGLWRDEATSTRAIAEALRELAHGDSSVALVCAMHPAVLYVGGWLTLHDPPGAAAEPWAQQRRWLFQSVRDGAWWGTITSEPGSGGDVFATRATARRAGEDDGGTAYRLTGQKHFGSGSGVTSFMVTSAVPEGEEQPDWFFLDVRGAPWEQAGGTTGVTGVTGVTLTAPWDGHGMTATQSHAMAFQDYPATRVAWPGALSRMVRRPSGVVPCAFTAVVVGIVETAMDTARQQLAPRHDALRAYERVEWARAEMEAWLIGQAYEGMLRATEREQGRGALHGKTAVAELAEAVLGRLCRVLGGGTYARHSPFGFWFEDVRALGFLRPPWGLAYDSLFAASWPPPA